MVRESSNTALLAAAARAAHPLVDAEPHVFTDPLAAALLGEQAEELLAYHRLHGDHPVLRGARAQVVVRARHAEARLAESGLRQYILLGAGLDSFAYRNNAGVRVFEVDHAASIESKRARLTAAAIAVPDSVRHVTVDFDADPLAEKLAAAGFDLAEPAFVSWLGVTMYLGEESLRRTLAALAGFAPGTQLVADYFVPPSRLDENAAAVARFSAEHGEPWLSCPTPAEMSALLTAHGFTPRTDLSLREAVDPALWQRTDGFRPNDNARLVHAARAQSV
ncbi:class I SAM-dependent methyltransferase [Amycolatopsis acidicola]|uniref:S-adenosyl-L-methionine-dependent methyltransferase n=1 Tax=Amycolatopsis acidicola TaxID=2596893 RepID=A0A5N0VHD0_9PSEU|nr:class I SAM-dependent methyltransferase [Amycolatopsis acidicola]KAA9165636.1 class I SAM-dependent methyltransferase [Amycolatopsis acidicola]